MKLFCVVFFLVGSSALAGSIRCDYLSQPCDEVGNHYACYSQETGPYCATFDHSDDDSEGSGYSCRMVPQTCGFNHQLCCDNAHRCTCGSL